MHTFNANTFYDNLVDSLFFRMTHRSIAMIVSYVDMQCITVNTKELGSKVYFKKSYFTYTCE